MYVCARVYSKIPLDQARLIDRTPATILSLGQFVSKACLGEFPPREKPKDCVSLTLTKFEGQKGEREKRTMSSDAKTNPPEPISDGILNPTKASVTVNVSAETNAGGRRHMEDFIKVELYPDKRFDDIPYLRDQIFVGVFDGHGGGLVREEATLGGDTRKSQVHGAQLRERLRVAGRIVCDDAQGDGAVER